MRFYQLGRESLWYDEVGSVDQATCALPSLFLDFFHDPPLYPLILRFWIKVFGVSETALRFPSFLFSIFSLILAYKIAKKLFNDDLALIVITLLAFSAFHIFYAQEARYYMLSFFLVLVSVFLFLKILEKHNIKSYYQLCIINILNLFANPLSFFLILLETVFLLRKNEAHKKLWIGLVSLSLFIFSFWGGLVFYNIKSDFGFFRERIILQTFLSPLQMLFETFETFASGGLRYGGTDYFLALAQNQNLGLFSIIWLNIIYAFLFLFSIPHFLKKQKNREKFYFIFLWLFLPILPFLILFRICSIRYFLVLLFPFYFIIAVGIYYAGTFKKTLLITLVFAFLPPLYLYYSRAVKIDLKGAISYINKNIKDYDTIIICPSMQSQILGYYYKYGAKYNVESGFRKDSLLRSNKSMVKGPFSVKQAENYFIGANNVDQLALLAKSNPDILTKLMQGQLWLVVTRWIPPQKEAEIRYYLERFLFLKDKTEFSGVFVYHFIPL